MAFVNYSLWSQEAMVAYAAGIIDGEGCISIANWSGTYRCYIEIAQCSEHGWLILDFLRDHFNGKMCGPYPCKGNRFPRKACIWYRSGAYDFLWKIRDYLIGKREVAAFCRKFHVLNEREKFSEQKAEEWRNIAKSFNKRGKV